MWMLTVWWNVYKIWADLQSNWLLIPEEIITKAEAPVNFKRILFFGCVENDLSIVLSVYNEDSLY